MVTSRNRNVPRTARYAHELKPLDPNRSWQLLLKKSFIDDTNGKCPPELEDIGREIVEKCAGLPLAITVMGGLLLEQRQLRSGWWKILREMNSLLGRSENSVSAILELSYHNLPPRLKSCFLCLGFFDEDAVISAKKLTQVWIAEGLISQDGREEAMEEIARGYLDELINRNIVQVKDIKKNDQVKNCQIHDLLRELSIKKAEDEIGFKNLREWNDKSQASDKIFRHQGIYCGGERFNLLTSPSGKHVRSLFLHTDDYIEDISSLNFKGFPLLRVLDFEGFCLTRLPKSIGELIGLKYLRLGNNKLKKLPKSLGRLINLQVFDIAKNFYYYIKVPNVIWKMYNLRHLYMSHIYSNTPLRLDTLKNLQTLVFVLESKWSPKHLMEMTNLRKLEVSIDENVSDVREFITSFAKMKNLASLKLRLTAIDVHTQVLSGLDTLHSVTKLQLHGHLAALPSVNNFPPNLSHLTLVWNNLHEDPMPVLEKLPNLLYLNLKDSAYVGRKMAISDEGFPRLRVFLTEYLTKLKKIEFVGEEHAGMLPELKRFEIKYCKELESLPDKLMTLAKESQIIKCPKLKTQIRW